MNNNVARRLDVIQPAAASTHPVRLDTERGCISGLRIGLVNMPFSSTRYPSIQLGLLHAIVENLGAATRSHHFNLEFAARIGWDLADQIADHNACHLLGEWMFAEAAFGDRAPAADAYEAAFEEQIDALCNETGRDIDLFRRIRRREVPAFLDQLMRQTAWARYDVVGFSSVFQQNCASLALARRIKSEQPHVLTVFGGANFDAGMGLEYVRALPQIDFAVIGEGDVAFPALLREIAAGNGAPEVPGVAYARNGRVHYYGDAPRVYELDDLPKPNYDDFFATAHALKMPERVLDVAVAVPFESARGCWWGQKHHCTFCGLNASGIAFRSKSPHRVLSDIEDLASRYRVYDFLTTDAILDPRYVVDVFEPLAAKRHDYSIFYEVKSNLPAKKLRALARGGVRIVQPGIESLNTHVLQLMNKGVTGIQNVRFLKWALYYGLDVKWQIIRGFPGELPEDYASMLETVRLITHLQPPSPKTHRIRLDRFSPNFERADEFGFEDVRPRSSYACVYPPELALEKIAYSFDYERPSTIPADTIAALDDALAGWRAAWDGPRPFLKYRRIGDRITVLDGRQDRDVAVHVLDGLAAEVYEACSVTSRSAPQLVRALALGGSGPSTDAVTQELDRLTDLGLMLREGPRHLSLALPANPHW